jgi:hypothetical protein
MLKSLFFFMLLFLLSCGKDDSTYEQAELYNLSDIQAKYGPISGLERINQAALLQAFSYFERYSQKFENIDYISLIDFSLHSGEERFFVIDLSNGKLSSYHTAHGAAGDPNHDGYVTSFSNEKNSEKSSLGFYRTAETYYSSKFKGTSLRLDGLSPSNSNARERDIVIHPARYVSPKFKKMGRSHGCPALAQNVSDKVINQIKRGSLIYAFHR